MLRLTEGRESRVIQDWLKEDSNCWIAIASAFLQRYDRELALEKLTLALQYQLRDGPPKPTTLGGRLYKSGLSRIDYKTLARELALAADVAEASIGK